MLSLRLNVLPSVLPGECYLVDKDCFGYYGVTPSLLRLPIVLMRLPDMTPLYVAAGLTLIVYLTSKMLNMVKVAPMVQLPMLISLTSGGFLLQLSRAAVYEEAIIWAVCFSLASFLRWREWTKTRKVGLLLQCIIMASLACNARPTAFGVCLALLVFTAGRREIRRFSVIFIVPIFSSLLVNYLKFRSAVPNLELNEQVPETTHWAQIMAANGARDISWRFIPSNLANYLRPEGFRILGHFPFIDFNVPSTSEPFWIGLPKGSMYVERMSSATASFIIPILIAFLVRGKKAENRDGRVFFGQVSFSDAGLCCLATATMTVPALTNVAVTNRYIGDFYPVAVGICGLLLSGRGEFKSDRKKSTLLPLIWVSLVASALTNLILAVRWGWSI